MPRVESTTESTHINRISLPVAPKGHAEIVVSVVMPCLDEEASVGQCVTQALGTLAQLGLPGEVIVCDNGSRDRSVSIAKAHGARVVLQPVRGYGNAYLKGCAAAQGHYILIADSDSSYDFGQLGEFVQALQAGADLVMGSRMRGQIQPGAMPWLHRYVGNPLLSSLLNVLFQAGISDAHCGMRAFTRSAWQRMDLRTGGMEFASEMVIKAAQLGLRIVEVPVTYAPRTGRSKLNSFRDGWRHLRFMLLYSPDGLFIVPGALLSVLGVFLCILLAFGPLTVAGFFADYHFMMLGALMLLLGVQVLSLGIFAKAYGYAVNLTLRPDSMLNWVIRHFNLERGILSGGMLFLMGLGLNLALLFEWLKFGGLHQPRIQQTILAMTLTILGVQLVFSAFLLSLMVMPSHLRGEVKPEIEEP